MCCNNYSQVLQYKDLADCLLKFGKEVLQFFFFPSRSELASPLHHWLNSVNTEIMLLGTSTPTEWTQSYVVQSIPETPGQHTVFLLIPI